MKALKLRSILHDPLMMGVLLLVLYVLWMFSRSYNLPGQNTMSFTLVLLVLSYQAHNLHMYYARNMLLAIIVVYLPHMMMMAERGSYYPRAYLSFLTQTLATLILINLLANMFGIFLK